MDEFAETIKQGSVDYTDLTASLVAAYVTNNHIQTGEIGALIASTHAALTGLGSPAASAAPTVDKPTPAQIRKSVTPDALISFIDGKPYKTLKRHLTGNGMTMEEYRERYGLPRDYPSTAASYSAQRSALAKSAGLGSQRRNAAATSKIASEKPKRAGRPRKVKDAGKA